MLEKSEDLTTGKTQKLKALKASLLKAVDAHPHRKFELYDRYHDDLTVIELQSHIGTMSQTDKGV